MVKTAETAPIDPLQLLKALGPLLSPEGGIKSSDEVTRLSSLMKKFSRKLVSRCVYCNVLRTTAPEILTKFLDEHGWDTLNSWFQDARDTDNHSFLRELLKLCKILPMTVERLKQNNTAKIVRSLSKSDNNEEVKALATDVVESWMSLIKGEKTEQLAADKIKKKKKKEVKPLKEKEKDVNEVKESGKEKIKTKHKEVKEKTEYEFKSRPRFEDYEDVKVTIIDEEPLLKRFKIDRPKTVKTFQGKFRSTGLEEETPLPKNVPKKTPTVNKSITVAVVKNAKRMNPVIERFPEKKIKPSSLITPAESSNTGVGIKLIPPKPKPVHVLHESASFMDALVAAPPPPVRRKKKAPASKSSPTSTTPPSPTLTPPKLQFYKETLDMAADESAQDKDNDSDKEKNKIQTRSSTRLKKEAILKEEAASKEVDELKEETKETIEEDFKDSEKESVDEMKSKESENEIISPKENEEPSSLKEEKKEESKEENETDVWTAESPPPPGQLRSILSHCKRRDSKKSVKWAEDTNLTSVYYFELDEMERVNVNHIRNFGDLKSLEMKREREGFEAARRLMGDKMEEAIPWTIPARILLPPPLIEPGCNSKEKDVQRIRQQTTLQDIYFSREMLPDSPYEPDPEPHSLLETKSIPLEDENNMGTLMDYSRIDLPAPKPILPDVLSNLVMSITNKNTQPTQEQQVVPNNMFPQLDSAHNFPPVSGENGMLPNHGLLGTAPQGFLPQMNNVNEMPNEWPTDDGCGPPPRMDPYMVCGPMNQPLQMPMMQNMRPPGPMMPPRFRMPGPDGMGPRMGRGQQMPRPQGSRSRGPPRILCKRFWNGTCRYGANCTFLHPGVNGPL